MEKNICEICGEEIIMEPEETHRGGQMKKMGAVTYEDGEPKYVCREHLSL